MSDFDWDRLEQEGLERAARLHAEGHFDVGPRSGWAWCEELTRIPTGRPEPCSLMLTHDGAHTFVPPGDCTGWHSPFIVCIRCDDGADS